MGTSTSLSRRRFLGLGAGTLAAAAAAAALGPLRSSPAQAAGLDPHTDGKVVRSVCEVCFWKCGIQGHSQGDRLVKIQGSPLHPLSNGKLCPRGVGGVGMAHDPDRLVKPLLRKGPRGAVGYRAKRGPLPQRAGHFYVGRHKVPVSALDRRIQMDTMWPCSRYGRRKSSRTGLMA